MSKNGRILRALARYAAHHSLDFRPLSVRMRLPSDAILVEPLSEGSALRCLGPEPEHVRFPHVPLLVSVRRLDRIVAATPAETERVVQTVSGRTRAVAQATDFLDRLLANRPKRSGSRSANDLASATLRPSSSF